MDAIINNFNETIAEGIQDSIADQILLLTEEMELIETELNNLKKTMVDKMTRTNVTSIKTKTAIFTLVEKSNIKIDAKKCRSFLDSAGIYEEFSKVDETKVKKIYPTAEFIKVEQPTTYLKITKNK